MGLKLVRIDKDKLQGFYITLTFPDIFYSNMTKTGIESIVSISNGDLIVIVGSDINYILLAFIILFLIKPVILWIY